MRKFGNFLKPPHEVPGGLQRLVGVCANPPQPTTLVIQPGLYANLPWQMTYSAKGLAGQTQNHGVKWNEVRKMGPLGEGALDIGGDSVLSNKFRQLVPPRVISTRQSNQQWAEIWCAINLQKKP